MSVPHLVLGHETPDGRARELALRVLASAEREPTDLVAFESAGNLLIVGERSHAAEAAKRINGALDCTLLVPSDSDAEPVFDSTDTGALLVGKIADLHGHLGCFEVDFATPHGITGLAQATGGWRGHFDLVLDLSEPPLNVSAIAPPGYYAVGTDPAALARALNELPGLVGQFEKPRFFSLDPDICAHSRSGIQACTRCIDTCPTQAIQSLGDAIGVDENLCQGVGSCATVCPTGAIRYHYPALGETLGALQEALKTYHAAGGSTPSLLFFGSEREQDLLHAIAPQLPEHIIPVQLEDAGSVGMDAWLAALAYGAAPVYVLMSPATPESAQHACREQMGYAHAMLEAMGYPLSALQVLVGADPSSLVDAVADNRLELVRKRAGFMPLDDKRQVIRLAVDHLHSQAPRARPMASLPTGAPFGEVWVDRQRCTLCMACVSQCPGRALESGQDVPQLRFIEQNCVQCAMCSRTCPEQAITIGPRYLFDPEQRRQRRLLNEDEPFRCTECGKVFATRSVIRRTTERLRDHPMFRGHALKRLKMCEDCRVRDAFREENGPPGP